MRRAAPTALVEERERVVVWMVGAQREVEAKGRREESRRQRRRWGQLQLVADARWTLSLTLTLTLALTLAQTLTLTLTLTLTPTR